MMYKLRMNLLFAASIAAACNNPFPSNDDTDSAGKDSGHDSEPIPEGCAVPVEDTIPLKDAYADHFLMGVALGPITFRGVDEDAVNLVTRHFNRISPENNLKWNQVEPQPGEFDFEIADKYVEFGTKRGMQVYGHVLVWHSQTPDWVFQDDNGDPLDREGLLARVESHIGALAKRYGGKIGYWDVVNEAFNDNGTLRNSDWRKIIGDDYIEQVFRIADRLLPDSKLVYNDYSMFLPGKRNAAVQLVTDLREAGVRIDAIGMQGHYNMDRPTPSELAETLSAFRDAGVEVVVTELDVDVLPSAWGIQNPDISNHETMEALNPYRECLPEEVDRAAADRWGELFAVFVAYSDVISGVTLWGVNDKYSWLNNFPVNGRTNYALLFDRNYRPKTSYMRVIEQAAGPMDSDTSIADAGDDAGDDAETAIGQK